MVGKKIRKRSAALIVDEIEQILSYGINRINVADDLFASDKAKVKEVCGEIQKTRPFLYLERLCTGQYGGPGNAADHEGYGLRQRQFRRRIGQSGDAQADQEKESPWIRSGRPSDSAMKWA